MVINQETSERKLNLDGRIVEVHRKVYPDGTKKWEFMRFRDDKKDGNFHKVVRNILQSINDNLNEEEVRIYAYAHICVFFTRVTSND